MRIEIQDQFWSDKSKYDAAEKHYYEGFSKVTEQNTYCPLVSEIAKAREHIQSSLEKMDGLTVESCGNAEILKRLTLVEKENQELKAQLAKISELVNKLSALHLGSGSAAAPAPAPIPAAKQEKIEKEDDDDVDLFGSDSEEESEEAVRIREERLAAYAAKKSKKAVIIAKSSLILDVKPWDDETDLKVMETEIRKITSDGLLWGASKFVPVAFGIQKLSISCVIEDDKISVDWLQEEIEKLEDYVQSVDVAAFNKI